MSVEIMINNPEDGTKLAKSLDMLVEDLTSEEYAKFEQTVMKSMLAKAQADLEEASDVPSLMEASRRVTYFKGYETPEQHSETIERFYDKLGMTKE